jgi:hypothetical protein
MAHPHRQFPINTIGRPIGVLCHDRSADDRTRGGPHTKTCPQTVAFAGVGQNVGHLSVDLLDRIGNATPFAAKGIGIHHIKDRNRDD